MSDVTESRASVALRAKADKDGQEAIKELTGVAQPTLSQLINLRRKPGRRVANALAKAGIKQTWWDEPPPRGAAA